MEDLPLKSQHLEQTIRLVKEVSQELVSPEQHAFLEALQSEFDRVYGPGTLNIDWGDSQNNTEILQHNTRGLSEVLSQSRIRDFLNTYPIISLNINVEIFTFLESLSLANVSYVRCEGGQYFRRAREHSNTGRMAEISNAPFISLAQLQSEITKHMRWRHPMQHFLLRKHRQLQTIELQEDTARAITGILAPQPSVCQR